MQTYATQDVVRIIEGYRMLERRGGLSRLLKTVSRCSKCAKCYPDRCDHPVSSLVRPLPLHRLLTESDVKRYAIRIKRDHAFLRELFATLSSADEVRGAMGSAKFAIGLSPWLDRCMLFRFSRQTKLMVVGIDYKHFPAFFSQARDHNFPLDSYRNKNNIWGPTWRRFWTNLLGSPYDDQRVDDFLASTGTYMTNSMLCFGGAASPGHHNYRYLECCRPHIESQIRIARPDIIVSFGNLGCRNVASMLLEENPDNNLVRRLAQSLSPLGIMRTAASRARVASGIAAQFASRPVVFWPMYQPARSHMYRFPGDYAVLRKLLGVTNTVRER